MRKEAVSVTLLWSLVSTILPVHADWITDYVRYTDTPELTQIVIESGRVRGRSSVTTAANAQSKLAERNVFVGAGTSDRVYKRSCKYGRHVVSTCITMHPPSGIGYGGGNYVAEVSVKIDGMKKVHCNLGYSARENNLHVQKVVIYPEDEFVEVVATAGVDNRRVSPPLRHCLFEDTHVISNQTLAYGAGLSLKEAPHHL